MTLEFWGWVAVGLSLSSVLGWVWLTLVRGRFWATDQRLGNRGEDNDFPWPAIVAVIPARDEAEFIEETITSVLAQQYRGRLSVCLVDDRSSDGTSELAGKAARKVKGFPPLKMVTTKERPEGWAGKVWALHQGVSTVSDEEHQYLWFTDADIVHSPDVLSSLVTKAEEDGLDLVSVMAKLHVSSFWDKLLIPAFVFFFGKLYPFRWVNDHNRDTAAAAGGCVLVRKGRLEQVGGLASMRDALIDDCALARLIRGPKSEGKLWLGLSHDVRSIRPYDGLKGIWDMVARTAYVQLRRNPIFLIGTVLGMVLLYLGPPAAVGVGIGSVALGSREAWAWILTSAGLGGWALMSVIYAPMLRWYRLGVWRSVFLIVAGFLYTLMTVDSAGRTWMGKGGEWKGRTF